MLQNFRCYQSSIQFYRLAVTLKLPRHLKEQFERAAASVTLNLAEGYGRSSFPDKRKYYQTALGSLRECQAVLALAGTSRKDLLGLSDQLGAMLYRLCSWTP